MSALGARGSTRRWRRIRLVVLARDSYRCRVPTERGTPCGRPATHVDHVTPRHLGGDDELDNLRAACARCNLERSNDGKARRAGLDRGWAW